MKRLNSVLLLCLCLSIAVVARANDEEKAPTPQQVESLVKQARLGDALSQYDLARAYELGSGAPRNYTEAVRWFKAAANQGDARAQYKLAVIFEEGRKGVRKDLAYAISWYEESARNGFKSAKQRLNAMTSSQTAL